MRSSPDKCTWRASHVLALGIVAFAAASAGYWLGVATSDIGYASRQIGGEPIAPRASGANIADMEKSAASAQSTASDLRPTGQGLWRALDGNPSSEARIKEMEAAISDWATSEPQAAIRLAEGESNLKNRRRFLLAALEGWGAVDAAGAFSWIQTLPAARRDEAYARIAMGAAARGSETLLRFADEEISAGRLTRERGFAVIKALSHHGAFEEATTFAVSTLVDGSMNEGLALAAYQSWAEHEPEAAAESALSLADSSLMNAAFGAVVQGWAQTEPADLAEFAHGLPPGPTRGYALGEALRQWVTLEPLSAAEWLDGVEPSRDLDSGVYALAMNPYLGESRPQVAISWAESLHDTNLRSEAIAQIVRQWVATDKKAAEQYVSDSKALSSSARAALLGLLAPR